jgi:hypothetical protein
MYVFKEVTLSSAELTQSLKEKPLGDLAIINSGVFLYYSLKDKFSGFCLLSQIAIISIASLITS